MSLVCLLSPCDTVIPKELQPQGGVTFAVLFVPPGCYNEMGRVATYAVPCSPVCIYNFTRNEQMTFPEQMTLAQELVLVYGCLLMTVLYRKIRNEGDVALLQSDLSYVLEWCSRWRINLNTKKCVHVTFTCKKRKKAG